MFSAQLFVDPNWWGNMLMLWKDSTTLSTAQIAGLKNLYNQSICTIHLIQEHT